MASLSSLPPRPPTPPKDTNQSIEDAIRFLDTSIHLDLVPKATSSGSSVGHASLNTPPDSSPTRKAKSDESPSSTRHKKIRFETSPSYCDGIHALDGANDTVVQLRPLPPKDLKYSKSILKPFDPPSSVELADAEHLTNHVTPHQFSSFIAMLESLLKQLAGSDRFSRLHAYITLTGSLRAYERTPEPDAIQARLHELEQYIRKDVVAVHPDTTNPDTKLRSQALKLASVLIWKLSSPQGFSHDFLSFLVDHATNAMKDASLAKEVVLNEMSLLGLQRIYGKHISGDKVLKVVTALKDVHERISGNNVICLRSMIYWRLVAFAPSVMLDTLQNWLDHVFTSMLGSHKDTSQMAIEAGLVAGLSLGTSRRAADYVRQLLDPAQQEDSSVYVEHLEKRLLEILETEQKLNVPRIWSVVILLSRGKPALLERWFRSNPLLKVMEKCFNSSDHTLNLEAFAAWDRAIFATSQVFLTRAAILRPLRAPIISTMLRKSSKKELAKVQEAALSSLCLLLYYAFGPHAKFEDLDTCWGELVLEFFEKIPFTGATGYEHGCRILSALFWDSSTKVWNADRALDTSLVRPEEVPKVNSHWLRKKTATVLKPFEKLLFNPHQSRIRLQDSPISTAWTSFLRAVSDAGSKEIKASADLKHNIAELLNSFFRIGAKVYLSDRNASSSNTVGLSGILMLMKAAVECLGPLHFTESIILRTKDGVFEASPSPSKHHDNSMSSPEPALVAMLRLLSKQDQMSQQDANLHDKVAGLIWLCYNVRPTLLSKLSLLVDCAEGLSHDSSETQTSTLVSVALEPIADIAYDSMIPGLPGYKRLDVDEANRIYPLHFRLLRMLFLSTDSSINAIGCRHYNNLRTLADTSGSEGLFVLAIAAPLIRLISNVPSSTRHFSQAMLWLSNVLQANVPTPTQRVLEYAQKSLEASDSRFKKRKLHDWPQTLISTLDNTLFSSYEALEELDESSVAQLLISATHIHDALSLGPATSLPVPMLTLLQSLQRGTSAWAEDKINKLAERKQLGDYPTAVMTNKIWTAMLALFSQLPSYDNAALHTLETLFCAGFQSRSKSIANATIEAWNRSFGCCDHLEYPSNLRRLFCRLQHLVDINLPTQPAKNQDELHSTLPSNESLFPWLSSREAQSEQGSKNDIFHHFPSPLPKRLSSPGIMSLPNTPTPQRNRLQKHMNKTPPARLRHDDSQIDFVPIDEAPTALSRVDSQKMTDHQQEVTTRQKADAALFADISSSPWSSNHPPVQLAPSSRVKENTAHDASDEQRDRLLIPDLEPVDHMSSSPLAARTRSSRHMSFDGPMDSSDPINGDGDEPQPDIPSSPPELPRTSTVTRSDLHEQPLFVVQDGQEPDRVEDLSEHSLNEHSVEDASQQLQTEMRQQSFLRAPARQANGTSPESVFTDADNAMNVALPNASIRANPIVSGETSYLQNLSPNSPRPNRRIDKPQQETPTSDKSGRVLDSFMEVEPRDQALKDSVIHSGHKFATAFHAQGTSKGIHRESEASNDETSSFQPHQPSQISRIETLRSPAAQGVFVDDASGLETANVVENTSAKRKIDALDDITTSKKPKTDNDNAVAEGDEDENDTILVIPRTPTTPSLLQVLRSRNLFTEQSKQTTPAAETEVAAGKKRRVSPSARMDSLEISSQADAKEQQSTPWSSKRLRLSQTSQTSQFETSSLRQTRRRTGHADSPEFVSLPSDTKRKRSELNNGSVHPNSTIERQAPGAHKNKQQDAVNHSFAQIEPTEPGTSDDVQVQSSQAEQLFEQGETRTVVDAPGVREKVIASPTSPDIGANSQAEIVAPETENAMGAGSLGVEEAGPAENKAKSTTGESDGLVQDPHTPQKVTQAGTAFMTPSKAGLTGPGEDTAPPAQSQSSSPGSLARNLIGRLGRILTDCRELILGPGYDAEKQELEDLGLGLQREIIDAGRRGRR